MNLLKTTPKFIEQSNLVHNFKYNYSKSEYLGCFIPIIIICPVHGEFQQRPSDHLSGKSCWKCNKLLSIKEAEKGLKNFIEKSSKIHKNKYDYSKSNYTGAKKLIDIICHFHGLFKQQPNSHMNGNGCKDCVRDKSAFGKRGFLNFSGNLATFYILKCWDKHEEFYKIGITSKTIKQRYPNKRKLPYDYEIITEIISQPINVWELERKYMRLLKNYKYKPVLLFKGYTECFKIKN